MLGKETQVAKSLEDYIFTYKEVRKEKTVSIGHPVATLGAGVASVIVGAILLSSHPMQIMPFAERNQCVVELYLPTGTAVEHTVKIADSIRTMLDDDERVESITAFMGCASPRFHTAYAPQMDESHFAQLLINTESEAATNAILDEYDGLFDSLFPEAVIKWKQLSYSEPNCPIEVRISAYDLDTLRHESEKVILAMQGLDGLRLIRTNYNRSRASTTIRLREDVMSRVTV